MRIGALWQEMYRSQYFEGGRTLTAAISAIDIALYDCLGPRCPPSPPQSELANPTSADEGVLAVRATPLPSFRAGHLC